MFNKLKGLFAKSEIQKDVNSSTFGVGMPIDFLVKTSGDINNVPILSFPIKMLYDVSNQSSTVTTIVRAITDEVFRNGLYIDERFKSKCVKCGAEYEEDVPICTECGSLTRKPDLTERKHLKEWLENFRNSFNEDLITIMKQVDDDVNRIDNGFILLRKEYFYTKDGKLFGFKVKDIIRASPFKIRLLISKYGIGRSKTGEYYYVCPEHRDELVKKDKEGVYYCDKCGKQLLPAWYSSVNKGKYLYYAKDEIYHVKRWSQTQGYGLPPILSVATKVLILMKMERFILTAYSLQRSPKGLLLIRGRIDSVTRAWEQLMQKAMEKPNMIYPLVIEGGDTSKRVVEYVDFSLKPEEMQWTDMRNELRKQIGARYGVSPLFQGDLSIGTGLNNEGLQITVTNRTIATSQEVWNRVLDWLSKQLGFADWRLRLSPNEEKDIKAQLERERMRIENARIMKDLGYEPILIEGLDGIAFKFKRIGDASSSSKGVNINSIRSILRQSSSQNDINEVEGSPEGRGKRAINQKYQAMPEKAVRKDYTTNKVKVRVIRDDGVQQSYYVGRDKLQSFIAQHEAKGQKVIVEGIGEITEQSIGAEILMQHMGEILKLIGDDEVITKITQLLTKYGTDEMTALGIGVFAYIIAKRIDLLNLLISDYQGKPIKKVNGFDDLRGLISDDIIEMWIKSINDLFIKQYGDATLSLPLTPDIAQRINQQKKSGSTKYFHDKSIATVHIGEIDGSPQTNANGKIIYFANDKAIIDCTDTGFDF